MVILTDVKEELFEGCHLIELIPMHLGQPVHVAMHVLIRNGGHGPHPVIKVRYLATVGSNVPGKKEFVRRGLLVEDVTPTVNTVTCKQCEVWSPTQFNFELSTIKGHCEKRFFTSLLPDPDTLHSDGP